jgi:hypothetical protein
MTPSGPIPDWASASGRSELAYPSPSDFRQFVTALGLRYNGFCEPPSCSGPDPPPRISFWSVWNEPNLVLFLRPQFAGVRGSQVGSTADSSWPRNAACGDPATARIAS